MCYVVFRGILFGVIYMSRILTVEQAAVALHLNVQTVREYLRDGRIPGAKVGKHWVIIEDDLHSQIRAGYSSCPPRTQRRVTSRRVSPGAGAPTCGAERTIRAADVLGMFSDLPRSSDDLARERSLENAQGEDALSDTHGSDVA